MSLTSRITHAWNAFFNKDPTRTNYDVAGYTYPYRPDRSRLTRDNAKTVVSSIYNRIALDVASISIQHVRLDDDDRFIGIIDDSLNECLTLQANKDQTARAFLQDVVISMFDEGEVAICPIDVDINKNGNKDILTMRTGKIVQWMPDDVRVLAYDDRTGKKDEIVFSKDEISIIENPLYPVINEPNSTAQRLVRKLALLDQTDEHNSSGKLDLIIQLPYSVKNELQEERANARKASIENQLTNTKYGIAYIDSTEHITQLNRSIDNQLLTEIEYLTRELYTQLGLTAEIMNGTADEKTMLNYYNRTIEPIVAAIVDEMKRKFLSRTARSQKQSIKYFRDPFKLVPVGELAELADKLTRNEIMTSNEIRQIMGLKPSSQPEADVLRNKNLNASDNQVFGEQVEAEEPTAGTASDYLNQSTQALNKIMEE